MPGIIAVLMLGCSVDTEPVRSNPPATPDVRDYDVAGDDSFVTRFEDRAPVPTGAVPAFFAGRVEDPAALDELLFQAEAEREVTEEIITGDVTGCVLLTAWALPEPASVTIGYEFDGFIDCAEAITYRLIFIVDTDGLPDSRRILYEPQPPA